MAKVLAESIPAENRVKPTRQPQRSQHGWHKEAAPQVIENFPTVDDGQAVGYIPCFGSDDGQQPGQQLPIAANPAAQTAGIDQVAGGIFFIQDDIRHQRGAPVNSLKEIVAEQGVFAHLTDQAALEGRTS